jgi:aspartyl-tRNA(Asn)/glutamyl-tRNA(Gln) amidotransferase subunit B
LFCGDRVVFGDPPNTHVCPVCLGLPGALPVLDRQAVDLALRAALALGCTVPRTSTWARKNYFYPDLPKGYQITQFEHPMGIGGRVDFDSDGGAKSLRIRRIHVEEDAGKSLHARRPGRTGIDLNRAGAPLVEIVTEPDLRSPGDARAFLQSLKRDLAYLDVSDCNMEQGGLRVDANVSVRRAGSAVLEAKVEIKNVNSFSYIEKALTQEIARQIESREAGSAVRAETRVWDDRRRELRTMRSKEESSDYRYFPEPDLPPLAFGPEELAAVRATLPELSRARRRRFVSEFGVSTYAAGVLTRTRAWADYFEALALDVAPGEAANWIMGPISAIVGEGGGSEAAIRVPPHRLAELIALVESAAISRSAGRTVLEAMAAEGVSAPEVVRREGLGQVADRQVLEGWIDTILNEDEGAVARYRAGEEQVLGHFMGRIMTLSAGRAHPTEVRRLLQEKLREG